MSDVRSEVAEASPSTRSAVSNGATLWINGVDGRSAEARRFRDVYADLVVHLGGADYASEPQKHLARRAAALVVWAEKEEARLAVGEDLNVQNYTTTANTLRRLLQDIGLHRVARDVTPSLSKFVNGIATAVDAGATNDSAPHQEPQDRSNLTSGHGCEDVGQ